MFNDLIKKEAIKVLKTLTGDEIIGFVYPITAVLGGAITGYKVVNPLGVTATNEGQTFIPYMISLPFPDCVVEIASQHVVVSPVDPHDAMRDAYMSLFKSTPDLILPDNKITLLK